VWKSLNECQNPENFTAEVGLGLVQGFSRLTLHRKSEESQSWLNPIPTTSLASDLDKTTHGF